MGRCMAPRTIPTTQSATMHGRKTIVERLVADQRLSARHPIVFGVSPCAMKLASIQTGNTSHDDQVDA